MIRWAIQNGDNNALSTWNDGATLGLPTSADDVFTNGFTVNMVANATYISMNNSARARDIATPIMTGFSTPSGIVRQSANSFSAFGWLMFDQNTGTSWDMSIGTGWIEYEFPTARRIIAYNIVGSATAFQFQYWDGAAWVTLHSASGVTATGGGYTSPDFTNPNSYTRYRLNITTSSGNQQQELRMYEFGTAALASGGSFNFNTAGVTVTCTSTSASLSAGATNLITVTATTGTVTLNLGSSVTGLNVTSSQIFNYTGNCNFNLSGINFNGGTTTSSLCINKSSTGIITIIGNLIGGTTGNAHSLNSTLGNTIVIGNVLGAAQGFGINQTAGNVTVTGNVTGGTASLVHGISLTGAASQFTINGNVTGGSGSSAHGINFGGTLGTVNGNVTGGGAIGARGITATAGGVNVTGNVTGNTTFGLVVGANSTIIGNVFGGSTAAGVGTDGNNSFTVTVTGDVYSSNTAAGIQLTGTGTQVVNLTGNMYNSLGRMAIWCPNVFISNTATTLWRVDTGGGDYKFLYSADTTPNLPPITDVRFGTTYGPALSLTGTMVVLANSDVRKDVPNDNSVGTAELTSADIISGINASSDPLAVRLKNALTDVTAGNLISQYKDS